MFYSLKFKLILFTVLVGLVFTGSIVVAAIQIQKKTLNQEFKLKTNNLIQLLSKNLINPIYNLKVNEITELINDYKLDEDIINIFVLDNLGLIISDGTEDNVLQDEKLNIFDEHKSTIIGNQIYSFEPKKHQLIVIKAVTTSTGVHLGHIVMDVSLQREENVILETLTSLIYLSLILFVCGLFITYFVALSFIKPILLIQKATNSISEGDFDIDLSFNRKDELGKLARSICIMSEKLNSTTVSKDFVNNIINTMGDCLFIINELGIIKSTNKHALTLFHCEDTFLVGKHLNSIFLDNVINDNSPIIMSGKECLLTTNDEKIEMSLSINELVNVNNSQTNTNDQLFVCIAQDIRHQKDIQNKLIHSMAEIEDSLKVKNQFLASVSHEIRTPMNGVIGMLRLLRTSNLDHQQLHYAKLATSNAESLLNLINDILDFSKIEAGKFQLDNTSFNLQEFLADTCESLAQSAQLKHIELILDVSESKHSIVYGDPNRLRQILTNILGNAIKFTLQGEVLVKVHSQLIDTFETSNLQLVIDVIDSGIGIKKEKIETLFDSFTQADSGTTRKFGGTGLGLTIAKQLSLLMGGNIQIVSELNKGSVFSIQLYLTFDPDKLRVSNTIDISNKKILVVANNKNVCLSLKKQLDQWGAETNITDNMDNALLKLSVDTFDFLYVDIENINDDSLNLAQFVKKEPAFGDIKIIAMTLMDQTISTHEFNIHLFDYQINKPITQMSLIESLTLFEQHKKDMVTLNKKEPIQDINNKKLTLTQNEETKEYKISVLLVEDNYVNQEIATALLDSLNIHVTTVENGEQALSILIKNTNLLQFDFILMDCQMPVMDGYTATQAIRAGKAGNKYKNIVIIAMTANAMAGDKEKCIDAGMNDYISKPVDPEILQNVLSNWVSLSGVTGTLQ